jgi:hypothetical protein
VRKKVTEEGGMEPVLFLARTEVCSVAHSLPYLSY